MGVILSTDLYYINILQPKPKRPLLSLVRPKYRWLTHYDSLLVLPQPASKAVPYYKRMFFKTVFVSREALWKAECTIICEQCCGTRFQAGKYKKRQLSYMKFNYNGGSLNSIF